MDDKIFDKIEDVDLKKKMEDSYIDYVGDSKTYNLLHLNALYDLQRNLYVDAIVQPRKNWNEHRAFTDMVDRYNSNIPTIYILQTEVMNHTTIWLTFKKRDNIS